MNLDEPQKQKIAAWIKEGLRLSDIQKRIGSELGINLTYMELRFLVDDLKLTPKDAEAPKTAPVNVAGAPGAQPGTKSPQGPGQVAPGPSAASPPSRVSVKLDELSRPGTLASGRVTFSDGNSAEWYLDQTGRLGLMPQQQNYRPSPEDLQEFQAELQDQLARIGF